ncbi:hypothetical protein KIN20_005875 [Parelaphostrongylus tenuis]|uniref:Uncharacterized protein n=1 Tax=Parelaphostrongylus tenuis TaxID=148309 RepID=A0AAD5MJJ9_PARTN|nr:hypothetical protein KIN20_005875 [Parelaphostrongylus tenuis]
MLYDAEKAIADHRFRCCCGCTRFQYGRNVGKHPQKHRIEAITNQPSTGRGQQCIGPFSMVLIHWKLRSR